MSFVLGMAYIAKLRRVTESRLLQSPYLSELLSESIPLINEMTATEIRQLTKSALIINQNFPKLKLNPQIFKLVNRRILLLGISHDVIATITSLSHIKRARQDGGPPLLAPATVSALLTQHHLLSAFDKCDLVSVLSRLGLRPTGVFLFTLKDVETLGLGENSSGRICGAIIALGKLELDSPTLSALLALLPSRLTTLSTRELANVLYACALAGAGDSLFISQVLRQLERKKSDISLASMNQIAMTSTDHSGSSFSDKCVALCESGEWKNVHSTSKAQSSISNALDSLGISSPLVREEFAVGPFLLDFAFPYLKLGIEIQGPFHYYHGTMNATAKTKFKRTKLESLGWRIAEIDYMQLKSEGDKVKLVDRIVRKALNPNEFEEGVHREKLLTLLNRLARTSIV